MKLSVGVEMEDYGGQAAAASNLFCYKSGEMGGGGGGEPSRLPVITNVQFTGLENISPISDSVRYHL